MPNINHAQAPATTGERAQLLIKETHRLVEETKRVLAESQDAIKRVRRVSTSSPRAARAIDEAASDTGDKEEP